MELFLNDLPGFSLAADLNLFDETHVDEGNLKFFQNICPIDPKSNYNAIYQKAFRYKSNLRWFHCTVHLNQWHNFVNFCINEKNTIHILEYWSVCVGVLNQHHRHILLVLDTKNYAQFKSKFPMEIRINEICREDRALLLNLMVFLSTKTKLCIHEINYSIFPTKSSAIYDEIIESQSLNEDFFFETNRFRGKTLSPDVILCGLLMDHDGFETYLQLKLLVARKFRPQIATKFNAGGYSIIKAEEIINLEEKQNFVFPLPHNYELRIVETLPHNITNLTVIFADKCYEVVVNNNLIALSSDQWLKYQKRHNNCLLKKLKKIKFHVSHM